MLIPTDLRKSLHHEYRIRAIIVFLFMFSLAVVIGIVSLLPSFVRVSAEQASIEKDLAALRGTSDEKTGQGASKEVAKQASALALFNDQSAGKTSYSSIIESIVGVRGMVKLNSFNITRTGTTTVVVVIQGISPSRDALVSFKGRLESARERNVVNLPVSELAKSKDLQFSLTVTNDKMP